MNTTFELHMWTLNEEEKNEYVKSEMEKRVKGNSRYNYNIAVELYDTFPILQEIWNYFPNEYYIRDRFRKKEDSVINKEKSSTTFEEKSPVEIPKEEKITALYLVGNTNFNPFTKEEFYWIKVGKTTDLYKRMKSYATHNPMLWKADYKIVPNEYLSSNEQICHFILKEYGTQDTNSQEWYQVSREVYLEICTKGFSFFEEHELYKRYDFLNSLTK